MNRNGDHLLLSLNSIYTKGGIISNGPTFIIKCVYIYINQLPLYLYFLLNPSFIDVDKAFDQFLLIVLKISHTGGVGIVEI